MFDFRYHVVTIIAVFLALGLGILLGVTIADRFVSSAERNLKGSLQDDLRDARSERAQARKDLRIRDDFEQRTYPTIVQSMLAGQHIGVVAIGELPGKLASAIRDALEPSGASMSAIGTIRAPLRLDRIGDRLADTPLRDLESNSKTQSALGKRIGRELITGGRLLRKTDQLLFSSRSGNFGGLNGVVYVRVKRSIEGHDKRVADRFESALLRGMADRKISLVGVEKTDADPSQAVFYRDHDMTSVDDIDLVAGRVALVFALSGAKGQFGIKPTATQLLPETQLTQR